MKRTLLLSTFTVWVVQVALAQQVTFAPAAKFRPNTRVPVALALGDFEGDGRRDIAISYTNGTQTILRNVTVGVPGPRTPSIDLSPLVSPAGGGDAVFADLNGDGADDWIATTPGANRLMIIGGGSSAFSSAPTLPRQPREIRAADLDGDGNPDIIVGYNQTTGVASILQGRGDGNVDNAVDRSVGGGPVLTVVDWNGDGALDIVAGAATSARVNVALNTGALTFGVPQVISTLPESGSWVVEGIAARGSTNIESAAIAVIARDVTGAKRTAYIIEPENVRHPTVALNAEGSLHVAFAEMDPDRRSDLVVVDVAQKRLIIRGGREDQTWPIIAALDEIEDAVAVVAGDLSGDGKPDVVIAFTSGELAVYVNTTAAGRSPRRRSVRH